MNAILSFVEITLFSVLLYRTFRSVHAPMLCSFQRCRDIIEVYCLGNTFITKNGIFCFLPCSHGGVSGMWSWAKICIVSEYINIKKTVKKTL